MIEDHTLPEAPDLVTDTWLTAVLHRTGTLSAACVVAHAVEPLLSQGAAGIVARFLLQYDREEEGAPPSIIGKFAAPYGPIRALLHAFGAYGREIQFYRHFGADPGIPTPRCYFGEINEANGAFALLLEDMGDARITEGTERSVEDAEMAVRHLAPFHAKWWNHRQLLGLEFLHYPGSAGEGAFMAQGRVALASALPVARARFGPGLPDTLVVLTERLLENFDALAAVRSRFQDSVTLVHGDYHPGQLFFPSERGGRFAVFDWQTVHAGNGGDDLARIIATGLTSEQRQAHDARLIELYHELLIEHGVREFDLERCQQSFRAGLLMTLALNIIAGANIDPAFIETFRAANEISPEEMMFGWLADAIEAHDAVSVLSG